VTKNCSETELSILFPDPLPKSKSGYASKPGLAEPSHTARIVKPSAPVFANVIQLKTYETNLFLGFGFTRDAEQSTSGPNYDEQAAIMLNCDTAKQLFCALAELFDCDVRPKS
jgi:hypothetical protein